MNTNVNKSKALEEEVGKKNGVEQAVATGTVAVLLCAKYGDCAIKSFCCYCFSLFDSTITKDFYKGATFHYPLNLVCFFLS